MTRRPNKTIICRYRRPTKVKISLYRNNSVVNIISNIAIFNPMSTAGKIIGLY